MILLALGANLPSVAGQPPDTLRAAFCELLDRKIVPTRQSQFFVSEAWPDARDPAFVNAVTAVETELDPSHLLSTLHEIETKFGRERGLRNAPRTLDIDLLDYHGQVQQGPPELPHPRLAERGFVLLPLMQVAPSWRHPVSGKSLSELIAALPPLSRNMVGLEAISPPVR